MSQTNMNGRQRALERRRALSAGGKAALGTTQPNQGRGRAKPELAKPESVRVGRQALSTRGKSAVSGGDRTRAPEPKAQAVVEATDRAGEAKRGSCDCGCKGEGRQETPRAMVNRAVARGRNGGNKKKAQMSSGRAQALVRRQALSSRGKAGLTGKPMSAAQTARVTNPELSGRELAKALREQRSQRGRGSERKAQPTGKIRPKVEVRVGAAQDASWKVGAGETGRGQTVTGTMANRSLKTTGNEAGTCREVTGTEYLGSDDMRSFCETEAAPRPAKVRKTSTFSANPVTGNETGRDAKVTGNEPGTCKRVTGTEYVSAEQEHAYCANAPEPGPAKVTGSRTLRGERVTGAQVGVSNKVTGNESGAGRALTGDQYLEGNNEETASNVTTSGGRGGQARAVPNKVGRSDTLRGGAVTGVMVGRREQMTGDEPGSCRNITGDDYVGREQYERFCDATPAPQDQKVGVSATVKGERITGTQTGRAARVTGDEPGTCKAVTGTPYAGLEQYAEYCEPRQTAGAQARAERPARRGGSVMTGIQPGIGGHLTGADKGACEALTGTPYVGADQMARACPAVPADVNSPDFPQPLDARTGVAGGPDAGVESWGEFSVQSPQRAAHEETGFDGVTGNRTARPGHITGPFGMAEGKVTGTEEARFGRRSAPAAPEAAETAAMIDGRVKPRISGEGQDAGVRITGDDWDRNPRVTGTEGASALTRNPTRRGAMGSAMPPLSERRPDDVPAPVSKVTGSSGNTETGSLITYSGGARG